MEHLKRCPYCDNELEYKDKVICSSCGFDFTTLKIKCNSCANYYPMEEKSCPKCNVASRIPFLSVYDIASLINFIKIRSYFLISALFDIIFIFIYIYKIDKGTVKADGLLIFILSVSKSFLYFYSKLKPHLSFLFSVFILLILCIAAVYASLIAYIFIPAPAAYVFFIYKFSKGYEAGLKIKENFTHLKRLF